MKTGNGNKSGNRIISGVGFNSGIGYKSGNNKVAGSSNARHRYGKPQRWASHGAPSGVTLKSDVGRSEIVPTIRSADGDGKIVIVDLEGVASQLVSRAISQADLVIVPMQPTALDAEIGSEALALVREEEEALGRSIRHAVVLTKTSAAVKSRVQKELEEQLSGAGIDVIEPSLVARAAFSELFAYGGDLTAMMNDPEMVTGGKVDKALANAQAFTEAVYERLK